MRNMYRSALRVRKDQVSEVGRLEIMANHNNSIWDPLQNETEIKMHRRVWTTARLPNKNFPTRRSRSPGTTIARTENLTWFRSKGFLVDVTARTASPKQVKNAATLDAHTRTSVSKFSWSLLYAASSIRLPQKLATHSKTHSDLDQRTFDAAKRCTQSQDKSTALSNHFVLSSQAAPRKRWPPLLAPRAVLSGRTTVGSHTYTAVLLFEADPVRERCAHVTLCAIPNCKLIDKTACGSGKPRECQGSTD